MIAEHLRGGASSGRHAETRHRGVNRRAKTLCALDYILLRLLRGTSVVVFCDAPCWTPRGGADAARPLAMPDHSAYRYHRYSHGEELPSRSYATRLPSRRAIVACCVVLAMVASCVHSFTDGGEAAAGEADLPTVCENGFPADFVWGLGTSAYQVEGGWNLTGRQPSIWDTFAHTPGKTTNGDTGDVACDHVHRVASDVALMRSIGLRHYRFSISWSRVMSWDASRRTVPSTSRRPCALGVS